ncbi:MAG: hypothetical protein AB7E61_03310 [Acholeplasmataceae bacterium]
MIYVILIVAVIILMLIKVFLLPTDKNTKKGYGSGHKYIPKIRPGDGRYRNR